MAPAPSTAATDNAYGTFRDRLAKLTGLSPLVVATWLVAEHGAPGNPLNIMVPLGGGRQAPANYGNPASAAQATARLLRSNPAYHPILVAASTGGPKEQLDAIAASPWDAGHYRGNDKNGRPIAANKAGTLLYGIWTGIVGGPPLPASRGGATGAYSADPPSPLPGHAGGVDSQGNAGASLNPADWIAGVESWLSDQGLIALLYVTFTFGALALIYAGLTKSTGTSPASAAAGAAGAAARFTPAGREAAAVKEFGF